MEKKRHTGRTILLVFLAILILIPVSVYCYLSFLGFHAGEKYAAYDPDAAYAGAPVFQADGTVDVALSEQDVYWIIDHYHVMDDVEATVGKLLKAYAVELKEGGIVLYADAKLLGFLPIPLKVTADASCNGSTVDLTVTDIHLGQWISVPTEKLSQFGVEKEMSFDLNDLDFRSKITGAQFLEKQVIVSERFMKEFSRDMLSAVTKSGVAHGLYLYEGESVLAEEPMMGTALGADPAQNGAEVTATDIVNAIASAPDQQEAFQTLLACITEENLPGVTEELDAFESHFIVDPALTASTPRHEALLKRLAEDQRKYETLLRDLRSAYQKKELTLDKQGFLDKDGNVLTLKSLAPDGSMPEEGSRIMLIRSDTAFNCVKTFDMPLLEDVPRTSDAAIKDAYAGIPYDLTIMLRLPCGMRACLYYQGDGSFIVNCIDEATAESFLADTNKPVWRISEGLPKPPTRTSHEALAEDLSPYVFLVPLHMGT